MQIDGLVAIRARRRAVGCACIFRFLLSTRKRGKVITDRCFEATVLPQLHLQDLATHAGSDLLYFGSELQLGINMDS